MKKFSFISLLVVSLLIFQPIYSQDTSQTCSKYRLLLKTGERMEIESAKLTSSKLILCKSENNLKEIPISDIRAIDRCVGSKALLYGGIGVGIGLLSSLLAIAEIQADPTRKLNDNAPGICAGITIGFGLIGALIGAGTDDWERVPLTPRTSAINFQRNYQFAFKIAL